MEQLVCEHYDARKRYDKKEACGVGRKVTNVVKNSCIQAHLESNKAITLFGAGHGAQIQFLESQMHIQLLHMYDLSEKALQSAAERAGVVPCTLHPCDFTQPLPIEEEHCQTQLVECGLCLHYAAVSESAWTQMLLNLKQLLLPKGKVVVTVPHAEHIVFLFRTQWVRIHCGCEWQAAYEALIKHGDDCEAAVRFLGGSPAVCGIPEDIAEKLATDDPDTQELLQRACGVVHIENVFTVLADFVIEWETPPTLGHAEWGKLYYFRLHAKHSDNSFCPEPLIPRIGWQLMAEHGLREALPRQTLMQWLWDRRMSSSELLWRALGSKPVDASVDAYLLTYTVCVYQLFQVPQRVKPQPKLAEYLLQRGQQPCASGGNIFFQKPLASTPVSHQWDRVKGWVKDTSDEEDVHTQFISSEEAIAEARRRTR